MNDTTTKTLGQTIDSFMALVTRDLKIEAAWLSAISNMEQIAAEQILGNITARTPTGLEAEIREHAGDEARHSGMLARMREECLGATVFPDSLIPLQDQMRRITGSFVTGYFGNPLLTEARDRHTAYVHGALTIEQFPFQIYSSYLKHTRLEPVRRELPVVLEDEHKHIALGKKMLEDIPSERRLPLNDLHRIEKDMVKKTIERLHAIVSEHLEGCATAGASGAGSSTASLSSSSASASPSPSRAASAEKELASRVGTGERARVAWIHALGHAERFAAEAMRAIFKRRGEAAPAMLEEHMADELRHSRLLQRSVLLTRRALWADPAYRALEHRLVRVMENYLKRLFTVVIQTVEPAPLVYLYGATALESRVFRHYGDLQAKMDDIGVSHILGRVLEDEARHGQMVQAASRTIAARTAPALQAILAREEQLFRETARKALALIVEDEQRAAGVAPGAVAGQRLVSRLTTREPEPAAALAL